MNSRGKTFFSISLLALFFGATTAFSQGYFLFATGKSSVYDGFTTQDVSIRNSTVNTAFLWAPANTIPLVDNYLISVPTNTTSSTPHVFTLQQAWSAILNDVNFTLAVDNNTAAVAVQLCNANGSLTSYNGSSAFPVTGTIPNTIYTLYLIGWDAQYATPALAAAANGGSGAALGWSSPFQYTAVDSFDSASNFTSAGQFGTIPPVPEPGMLSIMALGGLAILVRRRR